MSTAARKARKRAGIKFERKAKTPTPLEERHQPVSPFTKRGMLGLPTRRSQIAVADRQRTIARAERGEHFHRRPTRREVGL